MREPAMRKRQKPSSPFETLKITTGDDVNPPEVDRAPIAVVPEPEPAAEPDEVEDYPAQQPYVAQPPVQRAAARTPAGQRRAAPAAPPARARTMAEQAGWGERAPEHYEVPARRTSQRKGATVSINNRISVALDERLRAYLEESGDSVRDVLEVAIDEFLRSQGR